MDLNGIDINKLSPRQREKIESLRERIKQLEARELKILSTKSKQARADETRRAIVLGKRLEAAAKTDKQARKVLESLLPELEENFQYLFPEKWPDAQRPAPKAQTVTA